MQTEQENSRHNLQCKNGLGKEPFPETTSPGPNATMQKGETQTDNLQGGDGSPRILLTLRRVLHDQQYRTHVR